MKRLFVIFCFLLCANSAFAQKSKPNNSKPKPVESNKAAKSDEQAAPIAPQPIYPFDRAVFEHSPRHTVLVWEKFPNAVSYGIEVDCFDCCERGKWCAETGKTWMVKTNLKSTVYAFNYVGAEAARWRVWAIGANSKESDKSEWRRFSFVK